jgi:serine/threonine protein kinase
MSTVYKVRDLKLDGQEVALKILKSTLINSENIRERFRREAIISRKLDHPNIVRVFDFDTTPADEHFIIMECVTGKSLSSLFHISKPRLPLIDLGHILSEILDAMEYAHKQGVIHRDLKPQNVLLNDSGKIKVMDFGLARATGFISTLSAKGESIGTPWYMSPEQIRGGEIDNRTDIYTFGLLIYEAFHGTPPYAGEPWFAVADKHLREPLPDLPELTPSWFQALVERCTRKEPAERYCSVTEIREFMAKHI